MEVFRRGQIMARPRKPTAQLELEGAFKKNPQRKAAREGEPVVENPVGSPPKHVSKQAALIWRRVVKEAYWLRCTHRDVLEVFCVYKAAFEADPLAMMSAQVGNMMKALTELGLTAASQSKVKAPEKGKEETNPFAEFMN